jgi:glutathione S-transferase
MTLARRAPLGYQAAVLGRVAKMIVYGSSMSPFVRKVLVFAAEKGIEVESKPLGLGAKDPDFLEASPFGKIPGFRDGDFAISDSSAIVAYLEALQPEPALIPAAPRARARTIWWDEFADTVLAECSGRIFFNRIVAPMFLKRPGDEAAAAAAETEALPPLLAYLDRSIPESLFLVDDRLTLADIAVASPFANFGHLAIGIDAARYPRLAAYVARMLERPSFSHWVARETAFFKRVAAA